MPSFEAILWAESSVPVITLVIPECRSQKVKAIKTPRLHDAGNCLVRHLGTCIATSEIDFDKIRVIQVIILCIL